MAGITDIVTFMQGLIKSVNGVTAAINAGGLASTPTATTATAGSETLPSAPAGFLVVTRASGSQIKIPYYNP